MSTLTEQYQSFQNQLNAIKALLQGTRDRGKFYGMIGSYILWGCKVTEGFSATDMILCLDSAASGDGTHLNPDRQSPPSWPEEYGNFANIYGETFLSDDRNLSILDDAALTVATAPGAGYHRYDLVYAYVNEAGPSLAIAAGTAVLNASTPADPATPHGSLTLARVHVEESVTGIANAKITDLRNFTGRLQGAAPLIAGTSATNIAVGTGAKVFTVDRADYAWVATQELKISSRGTASTSMTGTVTSYVGTTLTMNITRIEGSGSHADWNVVISGIEGLPSYWFQGAGAPGGGLGNNSDMYLNTTNQDVYFKAAGSWSVVANIKGTAGSNGSTWLYGTAAASGGSNGDYYVRTTTLDVSYKSAGTWSIIFNIGGPQVFEQMTITAAAPTATQNFDVGTAAAKNPQIRYFTTNGANNWTLNVRGDGSTSLDSLMAVGDSLTITVWAAMGATPYYQTAMTIDSAAVTPKWLDGVAPSAGFASCINTYSFTILKTAAATFTVVGGLNRTT